MLYNGKEISIEELNLLLKDFPEDKELLELKEINDEYTQKLLKSKVFEIHNQKYYHKGENK